MWLYTNCKHCEQNLRTFTWEHTRPSYAMRKGKRVELHCNYCNREAVYHANELHARNRIGPIIMVIGVLASLFTAWYGFANFADSLSGSHNWVIPAAATIPSAIAGTWHFSLQTKARAFNAIRV